MTDALKTSDCFQTAAKTADARKHIKESDCHKASNLIKNSPPLHSHFVAFILGFVVDVVIVVFILVKSLVAGIFADFFLIRFFIGKFVLVGFIVETVLKIVLCAVFFEVGFLVVQLDPGRDAPALPGVPDDLRELGDAVAVRPPWAVRRYLVDSNGL